MVLTATKLWKSVFLRLRSKSFTNILNQIGSGTNLCGTPDNNIRKTLLVLVLFILNKNRKMGKSVN